MSDGIYAAQAARHTKLLQTYDKALMAKWLPDRKRWSIWTRDRRGNAYMVCICVDEGTGGFRQIGLYDIQKLGQMDMYRRQRARSLAEEVDRHNENLSEQKKQEFSTEISAFARDRWRQFAGNPVVRVGIDLKG